ncbi:MAG: hypothetical protein HY898_08870 [Deltaproteobacteria bacterium]|nr:hypothetical protein [Deltaproteobacteria bacterium]
MKDVLLLPCVAAFAALAMGACSGQEEQRQSVAGSSGAGQEGGPDGSGGIVDSGKGGEDASWDVKIDHGGGGAGGIPSTGGTGMGGHYQNDGGGGYGGPGAGGAGTGGSPEDAGAYALDSVCEMFPAQLCALRDGCCTMTTGYDTAVCLQREKSDCEAKVAEVKAAKRQYHPESIDRCLAAVEALSDQCWLSGATMVASFVATSLCAEVFNRVSGNGSCQQSSDCPGVEYGTHYYGCEAGKCVYREVGCAPCPCDAEILCRDELYCNDKSGPPVCVPVTPIGAQCSTTEECGVGRYCASGVCAAGQQGGAPCQSSNECASLVCDATSVCSPPALRFIAQQCGM